MDHGPVLLGYDAREANRKHAVDCTLTLPGAPDKFALAIWCIDHYAFAALSDGAVHPCDLRMPAVMPPPQQLGAGMYLREDQPINACAVSTASSTVRLACIFNLDTDKRVLRVMDFLPPLR